MKHLTMDIEKQAQDNADIRQELILECEYYNKRINKGLKTQEENYG